VRACVRVCVCVCVCVSREARSRTISWKLHQDRVVFVTDYDARDIEVKQIGPDYAVISGSIVRYDLRNSELGKKLRVGVGWWYRVAKMHEIP